MIRRAQSFIDIQHAIKLMEQFLQESAYADVVDVDREYLGRILGLAQQGGAVWLAYVRDEPVGLLIAIREPNMWNLRQYHLREVCWYVKPEYRKTTLGGRLFLAYQQYADELLKQKQISAYFTTQMSSTEPIDLERRGFELRERTYVKERV